MISSPQPVFMRKIHSQLSLKVAWLALITLFALPAFSVKSEPPFELKTLRLSQQNAAGGSKIVGVVTLSRRAPAQGLVVRLRSTDPALASVPKSILVPKDRKSAPFFIETHPVSSDQKITVTAIYAETKTAVLTLHPPGIAEVTVTPDTVIGGDNSIGNIRMEAALGIDTDVDLTSDNPTVKLEPTHVTVKKGETRLEFSVSTTAVKQKTSAMITAKTNGSTGTATLTVTP